MTWTHGGKTCACKSQLILLLKKVSGASFTNQPQSVVMVTNNRTETRLRKIISIFFCVISLTLVSVLLFVTIRPLLSTLKWKPLQRVTFYCLQMSPRTWAVSVTTFPEIFRCTFPRTQPLSAHAWIRASRRASVSEHYVIQICVSVEIRTANLIKLERRTVICPVMTTRTKSAVGSWHFRSTGQVRI